VHRLLMTIRVYYYTGVDSHLKIPDHERCYLLHDFFQFRKFQLCSLVTATPILSPLLIITSSSFFFALHVFEKKNWTIRPRRVSLAKPYSAMSCIAISDTCCQTACLLVSASLRPLFVCLQYVRTAQNCDRYEYIVASHVAYNGS